MKARNSLIVAGLLVCMSTSAYANFCQSPLKVVCEDTQTIRQERQEYINKIKGEIKQDAKARAQARIERLGNGGGILGSISRFFKKMKIENEEIINAAQSRISNFESNIVSPDIVATIKTYLKDAVDRSDLKSNVRADFKKTIDEVVVGNFADYVEKVGLKNHLLPQLFSAHCGLDGLIDNAFATKVEGDKYVLICPGWLVSLNQLKDKREVMSNVMQVLTHEISHHIDFHDFGAVYRPMVSCMADLYGRTFNRTGRDGSFCLESEQICTDEYNKGKENLDKKCKKEKDDCLKGSLPLFCGTREKLCLQTGKAKLFGQKLYCNKGAGEKCRIKVAESHMGEIAADFWGAQVMGLYMTNENLSIDESEQLISSNMMKLCGSKDEGIHPTGDFRVLEIVRKNPYVVNHLGCEKEEAQKTCNLSGIIDI